MLAARVEQKNQQTRARGRDKMVCTTLDKESPIQAVWELFRQLTTSGEFGF
jgi:hypothetical protein